jgi:hypothetical protein
MTKTPFNIIDIISKEQIKRTLNELGEMPLTSTGHGYEVFGSIPIMDAAIQSTHNYTVKTKEKPAMGLLIVVLAANRSYNKVVEPNIQRIERDYPRLKTFKHLLEILNSKSITDFFTFWGHKDYKKYNTIKELLTSINSDLRNIYPNINNDFKLMNCWAKDADLLNYKNDIIGKIPNIAIATFQHLRMLFGVDTVKPDQRVKEVLYYEFGLTKLSNEKAIKAVEQIALISNMQVITVDQILVKYGSSYYNQRAKKIDTKQIVRNLKALGVSKNIISKATELSLRQVENL